MKKYIYAMIAVFVTASANAHLASTQSSQAVSIVLQDVIEVAPASPGDAVVVYSSVEDYNAGRFITNSNTSLTGSEDAPEKFLWTVKSTKHFNVNVKVENPVDASSTFFQYIGASSIYNRWTLNSLTLKVTDVNIGTPSTNNFTSYTQLYAGSGIGPLMVSGKMGAVRNFKTLYKIVPGWAYAAGIYKAKVVYTATQI